MSFSCSIPRSDPVVDTTNFFDSYLPVTATPTISESEICHRRGMGRKQSSFGRCVVSCAGDMDQPSSDTTSHSQRSSPTGSKDTQGSRSKLQPARPPRVC